MSYAGSETEAIMQALGFKQNSTARSGGQGALPQHQAGKERILYLDVLWKWETAKEQAMVLYYIIKLRKSLSEMSPELEEQLLFVCLLNKSSQ